MANEVNWRIIHETIAEQTGVKEYQIYSAAGVHLFSLCKYYAENYSRLVTPDQPTSKRKIDEVYASINLFNPMRFLSLLIFTSLLSCIVRAQPIQKPKLFVTALNDQVLVRTT